MSRYTVEITLTVEATQQPDPQDFTFSESPTAKDIDLYFVDESWEIYEEARDE